MSTTSITNTSTATDQVDVRGPRFAAWIRSSRLIILVEVIAALLSIQDVVDDLGDQVAVGCGVLQTGHADDDEHAGAVAGVEHRPASATPFRVAQAALISGQGLVDVPDADFQAGRGQAPPDLVGVAASPGLVDHADSPPRRW